MNTTDDGLFQLGDLVQKKSGASWRGKVVGEYSTDLTARGYAVESLFEPGSVQIYPESALAPYTRTTPSLVTDDELTRCAVALAASEGKDYHKDGAIHFWRSGAEAVLAASDRDVLVAENARLREALEECRLIVAALPHGERLLLAKIDAALIPLAEEHPS